jgi:hypothetical protein
MDKKSIVNHRNFLLLTNSGAIQPVRTGTRVPVQIHLGVRRSGSFLLKFILN